MRTRNDIANGMLADLKNIMDAIPERTEEQQAEYFENPAGANVPPSKIKIKIAGEFIRHYYGVKTDNYLIDLGMEVNHLGYFGEYIAEEEEDNMMREYVLKAQQNYKRALEDYKRVKEMQSIAKEGFYGEE